MAEQQTVLPREGSFLEDSITSALSRALARHRRPRVILDNGTTGRCVQMSIKRCFGVPCSWALTISVPDGEDVELEFALYAEA